MYDLITCALLFFLLVPGVVVPALPGMNPLYSALLHAVVFYVVLSYISNFVPWWSLWVAAAVVIGLRLFSGMGSV